MTTDWKHVLPLDQEQHLSATGDMDPEAFCRYGHQIIDWIAAYLAEVGRYPVLSQNSPGALRRALPPHPPEQPEPMEEILSDVERRLLPGITHWTAPGCMAYFGFPGSGPGILGEMLCAALNSNAALWRTGPAATELEQVTLDWLRQLLGLPAPLFGIIHEGASSSTLHALVAAREAQADLRIREFGLSGRPEVPPLRYYASQEAHSSVEKAGIVLGVGQVGLRKIGVDDAFRMDVAQLEQAIQDDLARGFHPFAVVATVGTTSTSSVDPVPQIADVCERYGLWLHVDGAYGAAAAMHPDLRWVLTGCERADSLVVNPHKWLFTPIDCSVLYTRRPELLKAAFSLVPDYLRNAESEGDVVPNLMDYGIALSRRFRALKLWMVLRYFGQKGLAARIGEHCRLAQLVVGWLDEAPDFERLASVPLSVVCFRAHPRGLDDQVRLNELNERLLSRVNAAGHFFLSHTILRDAYAIRIAIGSLGTTEQNVRDLWQELQESLAALLDAQRLLSVSYHVP